MTDGALVVLSVAVSQPVGCPGSYATGSSVMPTSGCEPVLVMLTRAAAGFESRGVVKVTDALSTAMKGVGGGVIVNTADVAVARPGDVKESVRVPATPEMVRLENVATPLAAATLVVP